MKQLTIQLFVVFALFFSLPLLAENERHIHLNGEHLSNENIQLLDQIVGNLVGDGYYWLNMQTGQWGYEGNDQIQGVIASIANQQQSVANNSNNGGNDSDSYSDSYNDWEGVSSTGSVTSGRVNGKECTFVSVQGMTMKSCD